MKDNWLWDRKIADSEAKKALKNPGTEAFFTIAALLLSRKNEPNEVFKNYIDPIIFCKNWAGIKRKMRRDKWSEPRIIFWQAIYEKLADRYRRKGMVFREPAPPKKPFCEAIGKKIAAIRREQGLSQKGLAKKIGVSQQLISRIEKGGENISLSTLTNIAHSLNKTVEINITG
jgi:DNA-binding XRE family transcriptional regulator